MDNNIKGLLYEKQIRDYIRNTLNKKAYLWVDTPETLLINCGIIGSHNEARIKRKENRGNPLQDTGIDIIQEENENFVSLVQCKNGYKGGVTMNDLAGFMHWMFSFQNMKGYVYYTHKISENIKSLPPNPRLEYIKQKFIQEPIINKQEPIINKQELIINKQEPIINKQQINPYSYQLDAVKAFTELFIDNGKNRGILSLPCGCGKTFTSYLISQNYKQIIIISPLKQFAKQNLDRYIEYGFINNTLLIDSDSDGTRDKKEIKQFIKSNKSFLLSATFDSVDVIVKCLKYFNNPLFIVDEFHNLSKNNVIQSIEKKKEKDLIEKIEDIISDDESNEDLDDELDELEEEIEYIENDDYFYQLLKSDHKILFMSATPRIYDFEEEFDDYDYGNKLFGPIFYNMSFTHAIENKYITDYCIWLPSIHEDNTKLNNELSIYDIDSVIKSKCMFLYSCLLNNGSKKCIVYCVDTTEIKNMIDAIKKLNEFFILDIEITQITSKTPATKRGEILEEFATSDKIQLLFSVRILDECIDIPTCDSIYITYPSQSKIRTIQRLCRCIRIDKNNKFKVGNIFIWCDEYDSIINTISGIKEYDTLFTDKIKINQTGFFDNVKNEGILNDIQLIKNYTLNIKEFKQYTWYDKLDMVKKYIDENGKRPSHGDKDKFIKQIGKWLSHQQQNYKKNREIMKEKIIRNSWEDFIKKYKQYFLSNIEVWFDKLDMLEKYIKDNKKRPNSNNKDKSIKRMAQWISDQQINYKKNTDIMKNENIKKEWTNFTIKYKQYFLSNSEIWFNTLKLVEDYIIKNSKRPSNSDKDVENKQLARWIQTQQNNYIKNIDIMKYENIRKHWNIFTEKYIKYFLSNNEVWFDKLKKVEDYIIKNSNKPSDKDKDIEIKKLGSWVGHQQTNYKNNESIMKDETIKKVWFDFTTKYKQYFLSYNEIWFDTLKQVEDYIIKNNKRPSNSDKDFEIKRLAKWINTQQKNYLNNEQIMKDETIRKEWIQFIEKYKQYFLSNNELWFNNLKQVEDYIIKNNKRPSNSDKDFEIKRLAKWIGHQQENYSNNEYIMKDETIKKAWIEFTTKYKQYFLSNNELWFSNLKQVEDYIIKNNKKPSNSDKNVEIKRLAKWTSHQQENYSKNIKSMNDETIKKAWVDFTKKYLKLF